MTQSYDTVENIINGAAVELISVAPSADVLNDSNLVFRQLRYLLDAAGQELVRLHPWTELQKEHSITTDVLDTGSYDLPSDFCYMIPQAGWDRTNNNPLSGPLSAQDWQYIHGSSLGASSIYVSFRLKQKKFDILPNDPVTDNLDIRFEYISANWLQDPDVLTTYKDAVEKLGDISMIPALLLKKLIKVKFLEAKGFDSAKAGRDFVNMFNSMTGQDGSSPILNVGGSRGFPYLSMYRNVPDVGYGS